MGILQPGHLLLILVIVLILIGPGKLAGVGSALGKSVRDFKSSLVGGDEGSKATEEKAKTRP